MKAGAKACRHPPRQPLRRDDNSHEKNESLQTVEKEESADIERDVPDVDNEPIERDGREETPSSPIFEE